MTCLQVGQGLLYLPAGKVFEIIHNLSHPLVRATQRLVAQKFVWKGMQKQVGTWAKQCIPYQTTKIQTHVKAALEKFTVPHRRFYHIHVDLVGPLPPSKGFSYLLTVSDRFSQWPEATPIADTSTKHSAQALVFRGGSRGGGVCGVATPQNV